MTKYCTQCGAELTETQKFCNKCGLRLTPTQPTEPAQAAPTYQQPSYQPPPSAQTPYQSGYSPQAPTQQSYGGQTHAMGLAPNVVGALCYLFILAIVFLVIDPYNKDRFIRFHAWQSIFFFVAWVALRIILGIMFFFLPDFLVGAISLLLNLGFFVGWIWMIVQAYQNKMEKLPVIGDLAMQQVR